jgi:hypothetical protein
MHAAEHQGRADSKEADRRSLGSSSHLTHRWRKPDSNPRSLSGLNPFRAGGTGNRDVAHLQNGRSFHGGTEANPLCSSAESCANLTSGAGLVLVKEMVKKADVFTENFAPGAVERLGARAGRPHRRACPQSAAGYQP